MRACPCLLGLNGKAVNFLSRDSGFNFFVPGYPGISRDMNFSKSYLIKSCPISVNFSSKALLVCSPHIRKDH